jgi:glyoxylase-like metal-dependent hydrolase (beta-lactamase superfamily II)
MPISDVKCIPVPTPFAIGPVNAYLIEDAPLTLIDSGPNSLTAFDALAAGLAAHGHAVEDLELLLVTHEHIDHLGLTAALAARSGADIACLDAMAPYVASFPTYAERDDDAAAALMRRHGVHRDVVEALSSFATITRHWGASFGVQRQLTHGSAVELGGRSLRVLHAPGHSPSDTLFFDDAHGILFGGDHLLAKISSNALVASARSMGRQNGAATSRRPALIEYLASLKATRDLDIEVVFAGHGPPVADHRALIDARIAHHEHRADEILGIVRERPRSAHEIAERIWGRVAVTQAYLTLSEVLGHLDLLVAHGLVAECDAGKVVGFAAC